MESDLAVRIKTLAVVMTQVQLAQASVEHSNRDARLSPSEWYVDAAWTLRHRLTTSASWAVQPGRAALTLNYTAVVI